MAIPTPTNLKPIAVAPKPSKPAVKRPFVPREHLTYRVGDVALALRGWNK